MRRLADADADATEADDGACAWTALARLVIAAGREGDAALLRCAVAVCPCLRGARRRDAAAW
jgi:hypothetical protein